MLKPIYIFLFLSITILFTGCYKFPDEDHLSIVPMTNNPTVIPQKQKMGAGMGIEH